MRRDKVSDTHERRRQRKDLLHQISEAGIKRHAVCIYQLKLEIMIQRSLVVGGGEGPGALMDIARRRRCRCFEQTNVSTLQSKERSNHFLHQNRFLVSRRELCICGIATRTIHVIMFISIIYFP